MENLRVLGHYFQPPYTEQEIPSKDFPFRASFLFMEFPYRETQLRERLLNREAHQVFSVYQYVLVHI